jgi:hypothetical protein
MTAPTQRVAIVARTIRSGLQAGKLFKLQPAEYRILTPNAYDVRGRWFDRVIWDMPAEEAPRELVMALARVTTRS